MPITVSYQPSASIYGPLAYQAGLGDYRRFLQQQQLQRDLQSQQLEARAAEQAKLLEDQRYRDSLQQANQRYLGQLSAWDAQRRQLMGLAGDEQQQLRSIADAQFRQRVGIGADAAQQQRTQALQAGLAAQQIAAQQQRDQFDLYGRQMLGQQQFGQQAALQQQQFGQNMELQGLRGQQQFGLTQLEQGGRLGLLESQFMLENQIGPYSGMQAQISAKAAFLEDQKYAQQMRALDDAYAGGGISDSAYQRAKNGIVSQRAGLRENIGLDRAMQQKMLDESRYEWDLGNGSKIPVWWDGRGTPQPIEDPVARHAADAAKTQFNAGMDLIKQQFEMKKALVEAYVKSAMEMGGGFDEKGKPVPVDFATIQANVQQLMMLSPQEAAALKQRNADRIRNGAPPEAGIPATAI